VAHQSHTASLGSAVEEGNLNLILLKCLSIFEGGSPSGFSIHSLLVVVKDGKLGASIAIDLNFVAVANAKARLIRRTEMSVSCMSKISSAMALGIRTAKPSLPWSPPPHPLTQYVCFARRASDQVRGRLASPK